MKRKFFHLKSYFLNLKSKSVWVALVILAIFLPIAYIMLNRPDSAKAAWWDGNFKYRTAYAFTATSAVTTERKVKVDLDTATLITATKMQSDCDDVRFTDANGQLLDFFIDTNTADCNNASTDFYIKLPDIKVGGNLVYLYYGNANALRSSPGGRKNDFFDEKGLSTALKGYWKLNESAANTCDGGTNDSCDSALANDGAWTGDATTTTTAKINRAITLDDSGDYINNGTSSTLEPTVGLTASAFVRRTGSLASFDGIISSRKDNANTGGYILAGIGGDKIRFYVNSQAGLGSWVFAESDSTLTINEWYHLVGTWDGTTVRLYINGQLQSTTGSASAITYPSSPTQNHFIGVYGLAGGEQYWPGQIDEARVYGRALSQSEITMAYHGDRGMEIPTPVTFTPSSGPTASTEETTPGPIAYWKFDEGTGQGVQDQTTHRNNGTLGATSSSSSDDPTWVEEGRCVVGKCLQFDGGDQVNFGDTTMLDGLPGVAFSGWIKPNVLTGGTLSTVFGKGTYQTSTSDTFYAFFTSGNLLRVGINTAETAGNTEASLSSASNYFPLNQWTHLAVTWSSGDTVKIYVNGKYVTQSATRTGTLRNTSASLKLGAEEGGTYTPFKGFMDDVKFYPYGRSAAEVKADYSAGAAVLGAADQKDYLSDGLVGYWKMDETASPAVDSSGNDVSGTWTNQATSAVGKFGNGIILDGVDDKVDLGTSGVGNKINGGSVVTGSAWTYSTSYPDSALGANAIDKILHVFVNGTSTGFNLEVVNETGTPSFKCSGRSSGSDARQQITYAHPGLNQWIHLTCVLDYANDDIFMYINGVLVASDTNVAFGSNTFTLGTPTATDSIGSYTTAFPTHYFTGTIDEVRVYNNRRFSSDEVRNLYNWAPGPVGYWNFDEGGGQTPADLSGNAYTTTLGTNSSVGTDDPVWTNGKFGKALRFDGSNDYVEAGDTTTFKWMHGANDSANFKFSVGAWVRLSSTPRSWDIIFGTVPFDGNSVGVFYGIQSDASVTAYVLNGPGAGDPLNGHSTSANAVPNDNKWHYVAWTYDESLSSANSSLYVDGKLLSTGNKNASPSPSSANSSNNPSIGSQAESSQGNFRGDIDEVKIYNYVRTNAQLIEDMNAGHPAGGSPVGSQVLKYRFDEQNGAGARNSIENAGIATGAISGATWKTKTDCKMNGCLDFDGSDDVVTVTNANPIDLNVNLASGFTMGSWIYVDSDGEADTGQIFQKGTTTYCRTDTESAGRVDIQCSLDLATTDATLNISSAIATGTWNHVMVSYTDDSDDEITIWINGINRGTSADGSGAPAAESSNLLIGGTTTANFDGRIDEFDIYNSELSVDQIRVDMNANSSLSFSVLGASESAELSDGGGAGPVLEVNFEDNGGQAVVDTSGNGNSGTLGADSSVASDDPAWIGVTGAPSGANGLGGSALSFDGTADYVSTTNSSLIDDLTTVTISAWVKVNTYSTQKAVFSNYMGTGASDRGILIETGLSSNDVLVSVKGDTVNQWATSSTGIYNPGEWHYWTLVYDGSQSTNATKLKFYLDGRQQTLSFSGTVPTTTGNSSNVLKVGASIDSNATRYFPGIIDGVKIYNYARTAAQVAYDYNRGAPIGWWKLDECQGSTANDSSGNGNHGTITIGATGTQTAVGTCPTASTAWGNGATGKYSSSLNFDGTDDYVDLGSNISSVLSPTSAVSISTWFKSTDTSGVIIRNRSGGYALEIGDATQAGGTANRINFWIYNGSFNFATSTTSYHDGNWHHATGTYDGVTVRLYIDGKLQASTSVTGAITYISGGIALGRDGDRAVGYYAGQMDDMRIYNYALSAAQVKKVMNEGSAVRYGVNN